MKNKFDLVFEQIKSKLSDSSVFLNVNDAKNNGSLFMEKEICDAIENKQLISFFYFTKNKYGDAIEYEMTVLPIEIYKAGSLSNSVQMLKAYKDGNPSEERTLYMERIIPFGTIQKQRKEVEKSARYLRDCTNFKEEIEKAISSNEIVKFWYAWNNEAVDKLAVLPTKIETDGNDWKVICYEWGLKQPYYMLELSCSKMMTYEEVRKMDEDGL